MLTAREMARNEPVNFVVLARTQSAGYGRKGSPWLSPEGGLWFTLVVDVSRIEGLSLFFSLPLLRVLSRYLPQARIKWPNDIMIGGKKLAGILTEVHGRAFLGVGINVNNAIPPDLEQIAVSLSTLQRKSVNVRTLLTEILKEVEGLLPLFQKEGLSPFLSEYQKNLLYLGERIRLQTVEEVLEGILRGVTAEGALQLEVNGEMRIVVEAGFVSTG